MECGFGRVKNRPGSCRSRRGFSNREKWWSAPSGFGRGMPEVRGKGSPDIQIAVDISFLLFISIFFFSFSLSLVRA